MIPDGQATTIGASDRLTSGPTQTSWRRRLTAAALEHSVLWLGILVFLLVWPLRPEMAGATNLEILLLSATLLLPLAIGQTFVMIAGGIDLSLPAVMSLASVVGCSLLVGEALFSVDSPLAIGAAVAVMLLVGVAVGAVQGAAVGLFKMPAFLVSLASLILLGGVAVWYTHSERIAVPVSFTQIWYGRWFGVPVPVYFVGALAILAHVILARSILGRWLYAIGQNRAAARISGVPVVGATIFAFAASGFCAAVAAVFYTARLYTGSPQLVESEILLDCIGAVVIGGTSLYGGKGRIAGTLLGVLFLALVGNSLNMLGLRYWHVIMIKGAVILLAALLDAARSRFAAT